MFLSTSHNKIDLKCRVSIPASFRVNLEKSNETLILFKSLQFNCIEGTTSTRMQAYIDAIDELDALSDDLNSSKAIAIINKIPTTTAVNPVLPPASTPAELST